MDMDHQYITSGEPPGPTDSVISVQPALAGWKAARMLLANAIQTYKAASVTLGATCTRASHQTLEGEAIENALLEINDLTPGLVLEEETLRNTRLSLLRLRNQSKTLIPINAYPKEVLIRILSFVKDRCLREGSRNFNTTAEVCSYWREVVLNQPKMWTHIDITPGNSYRTPSVFLERSRDLSLYIHINDRTQAPAPSLHVRQVIQLLMPHMHRIRSLDLNTRHETVPSGTLGLLLEAWRDHGPPDATAFYFNRSRGRNTYYPDIVDFGDEEGDHGRFTHIVPSDVLLSIRILHLQAALFDNKNPVYHGLTDLRLSAPMFQHFDVPIALLTNVFAMSPQLATLKLQNVLVVTEENWISPEPFQLNHLRTLNLVGLEASCLKLLLPLITQPNPHAQLNVGLTFALHGALDEIRRFFAQSQIATVYRQDDHQRLMLWGVVNPVKHLIVHHVHVLEPQSVMFQRAEERGLITGPLPSVPIPQITLLECLVTLEGLVDLVRVTNAQSLRLDNCDYVGGMLLEDEEQMERLNPADLIVALLNACPGLKCIVSEIDSTYWLPCRTWSGD